MTRFYARQIDDAYGCARCPSVAPFAPRHETPGVAGVYPKTRMGSLPPFMVRRGPAQIVGPDWLPSVQPSMFSIRVNGLRGLRGVAWNDPQPSGQTVRTLFYVTVAGSAQPYPRGTISGLRWSARVSARITQAASPLDQRTTFYVTDEWTVTGGLTPERIRTLVRAKYVSSGFTVTGGGSVQVRVCTTSGSCSYVTPAGTSTPSGPAIPVPGVDTSNPQEEGDTGPLTTVELAQLVVMNLNETGRNYNRPLMRDFQRAAGIGVDGAYGNQTRTALLRYVPSAPTVAEVMNRAGTPRDPRPDQPHPSVAQPGNRLPAEEGGSVWGWVAAGLGIATIIIGATVASRSRSERRLMGLMGYV